MIQCIKVFLLILICYFLFNSVQKVTAQSDCPGGSPLIIETRLHYGFLWPHHEVLKYLVEEHVTGIQLLAGFRTPGHRAWHRVHNNPVIGLGIHYSGLGNSKVFGSSTALFGFINSSLFKRKNIQSQRQNKLSFNYLFAVGISYVSKPFDENTNYYNIAIGNHINSYLNLALDMKYRFLPKWDWVNGISLMHISNGGIKRPNLGLNIPTIFTGLRYSFSTNPRQKPILERFKPASEVQGLRKSLFASCGWKEISRATEKKYLTFSVVPEFMYAYNEKYWFGGGPDLFLDFSIKDALIEKQDSTSAMVFLRSGIHGGVDLVYGRTNFIIQTGIYLLAPHNYDGLIYNRFGLRHQITKTLLLNLTLKTHLGKADFIEWGLGYRFTSSKAKKGLKKTKL